LLFRIVPHISKGVQGERENVMVKYPKKRVEKEKYKKIKKLKKLKKGLALSKKM